MPMSLIDWHMLGAWTASSANHNKAISQHRAFCEAVMGADFLLSQFIIVHFLLAAFADQVSDHSHLHTACEQTSGSITTCQRLILVVFAEHFKLG